MTTTRRSKIWKLGVKVREELCERMENGEDGGTLLPWLNFNLRGSAAITPQNLSEWRAGGYEDWKRDRTRADQIRYLSELSRRLAKADGGNMAQGAVAVAGGRLLELLESAEGDSLNKITAALTGLRAVEIGAQKLKIDQVKLGQKDRELQLAEDRFRRQTAELFLKFYANKKAADIAEGKATREVKLDHLVQLMFGDRPAPPPG